MTEIGTFEMIVLLIQGVLFGVWSTLLWVELRHKIDTIWGRGCVRMLNWMLLGAYLIFGS